MSRLHRESLKRWIHPILDIIQMGADGPASFYQVQVNEEPVAEIFMEFAANGGMAELWVKKSGQEIARIRIQTVGVNWLRDAHSSVASLLREFWPGAIVRFWTRGQLFTVETA
jgi:hypothetical protein